MERRHVFCGDTKGVDGDRDILQDLELLDTPPLFMDLWIFVEKFMDLPDVYKCVSIHRYVCCMTHTQNIQK